MSTRRKNTDQLFIWLCENYHEKILRYLYYSIGNTEDAKDLTQEVFTIVYEHIEKLIYHENQAGFIYQTAKYTASNFKRKEFKKMEKEQVIEEYDLLATQGDTYDEMLYMQDQAINEKQYLISVLEDISPEKKELYNLHYVEKKTYKEIAQLLNMNEASLRMKYVRLRRELKNHVTMIAKQNFE